MYGKRERERKKPDERLSSGGCPSGSKKSTQGSFPVSIAGS